MIRVIVCPSQYITAVITQYQFAPLITILILITSLKWNPLCYYTRQLLFFSDAFTKMLHLQEDLQKGFF